MVFESVDPTVASRVRSPHPSRPSLLERTDAEIISALKAGDDLVFGALVDLWGGMMLRLALSHVGSRAVAEEVVQDAWLTVIRSLNRFEGRSALRTWVLGIVVNLARSSARDERRAIAADPQGPSVDPARFLPAAHPRWPHHWATEPSPWRTPEDELLAGEARRLVLKAIDAYGASTLVCVPVSLAKNGPALGAQAGEARLREVLLNQGGFTRIRRAAETPFNIVLEARP
jgi:RNA polymerase sigma factor (sigma-70 family)